jgi:hypothetical protein
VTRIDIFLLILTRVVWERKGGPSLVRVKVEKVGALNADKVM